MIVHVVSAPPRRGWGLTPVDFPQGSSNLVEAGFLGTGRSPSFAGEANPICSTSLGPLEMNLVVVVRESVRRHSGVCQRLGGGSGMWLLTAGQPLQSGGEA
jgi:hypothetical protein